MKKRDIYYLGCISETAGLVGGLAENKYLGLGLELEVDFDLDLEDDGNSIFIGSGRKENMWWHTRHQQCTVTIQYSLCDLPYQAYCSYRIHGEATLVTTHE